MLLVLSYFVLFLYALSIVLLFLYSLSQLNLLFNYLRSKRQKTVIEKFNFDNENEIPIVTIQLPIYNEKYVVADLLKSICDIEYPRNKLEIQVRYKNRIGISKVSGTVKGTIMAGIKIIGWILKYSLKK